MTTPLTQTNNVAVATWFLQADGTQLATFKTVSGVSLELGVVELQQTSASGKLQITKSVASGGIKPGKITCTRGLVLDDSMWTWFQNTIDGNMDLCRKNISVVLYGANNTEIKRYNFRNAWPSSWALGDLDSSGADALMETLTIEHEGFSLSGKNGL